LMPASLVVNLPQQGPSIERFVSPLTVAIEAVSHNWRGRAPPSP
jgi:hypothetical protein